MKRIQYGLIIAAVVLGVALAGATYAGWIPLPTDFFVGASQHSGG
jgi:hypothetical protein